jgi:dolichol-phosphate mannosyltransferase
LLRKCCVRSPGARRVVGAIDGDLQNDPADIPRLLTEIERGADLVCGYRAHRKDTLVKRLTSWVAKFVHRGPLHFRAEP